MITNVGLLSLLVTAATTAATRLLSDATNTPQAIPGAYILEFSDGHDHDAALNAINQDASTRINLHYDLFKGVSVQIDDADNATQKAEKLAALPSVKAMWPVMSVPAPNPRVEWIGSQGLDAIAHLTNSGPILSRSEQQDTLTTAQRMSQIERLRADGFLGQGIKIAVVDTGIDYTHPALGNGCFGKDDCLVTHGYDFVGDDYDANARPTVKPDEDPMDCNGHGTHVAGIVAAQDNMFNFTGVAPKVTLGGYRVFGCNGSASSDVLIAAFNKAFDDGADIISASIGGPSGWMDEAWATAISRIVARGVPCTVSAGNEGSNGLFFPSSGSSGKDVMSIASFDNTDKLVLFNTMSYDVDAGPKQQLELVPGSNDEWDGVDLELWATSYDTNKTDDGCSPYPAGTPDLSNKVVLIHRGSCKFTEKAGNATMAGARYIIFYNSNDDIFNIGLTDISSIKAAGMITQEAGINLIKLLKDGKKVTVQMKSSKNAAKRLQLGPNAATGGALSDYTTFGPSWEMNIKPTFGAPGGSILSTFPVAKGSFAVLSGTSMAAPFAAASVALLIQVRGTRDPKTLTNLLAANANPQLWNNKTKFFDKLAPVPQQGAGLIQVYDAAHATTLLEPSGLSFNDTANAPKKLTFKLSNTGDDEISYKIGQVSALTMYPLGPTGTQVKEFPNEIVDTSAKLKFSRDQVTLDAGRSASIDVSVTPPPGLDPRRLGVWSGYVTVNGTDGTSLSIPYQGLTGSLYAATNLGEKDAWVANSDDKNSQPVPANTTFTLPAPGKTRKMRLPAFVINMSLGSKNITAHLQPMTTVPDNSTSDYFGYKTIGQPMDFPAITRSREKIVEVWDGKMQDTSYAPAGTYRLVVRALRIYGDPKKKKDWNVSITSSFSIVYEK